MAKPTVEILDEENLAGMPDEIIITIPMTDDLNKRMIEPCVRWLAENADTVVDLDDEGRLRAGVEFEPGLSHITFDIEEAVVASIDEEDLPTAIIALERIADTLRGMLPASAEERAELRPANYDKLPPDKQAAIDRVLGLDKDQTA